MMQNLIIGIISEPKLETRFLKTPGFIDDVNSQYSNAKSQWQAKNPGKRLQRTMKATYYAIDYPIILREVQISCKYSA